jgi:hypothetical protein
MVKVHSIFMTRNDDLIIEHWIEKHVKIFENISVVDGSDGDFTKNLCEKYNLFYTRDPKPTDTKPFHEQYLREAAHNLLVDAGVLEIGDWVVCSQADEWYYHDPRKVINHVEPNVDVISWNQLNILPHPSEKEIYLSCTDYNPTKIFKHYWVRDNYKTCFEPRMFKYSGNEVWSHHIPSGNPVAGRIEPVSHNTKSHLIPTYYHYKVFDLNPEKYKSDGFGHFTKSRLNTGLGYGKGGSARSINNFEDLFFDESNIYCNLGRGDDGSEYIHGYCLKIPDDGLLPENVPFNVLGNDSKFLLTE